jgi:hypothetical protein
MKCYSTVEKTRQVTNMHSTDEPPDCCVKHSVEEGRPRAIDSTYVEFWKDNAVMMERMSVVVGVSVRGEEGN